MVRIIVFPDPSEDLRCDSTLHVLIIEKDDPLDNLPRPSFNELQRQFVLECH